MTKTTLVWFLLLLLCVNQASADDVDDFVSLFNQGKLEEAKTKVKGYVDPRLLKPEFRPLKIILQAKMTNAVSTAALLNLKNNPDSSQAKEAALVALAEIRRISKELKLEVKLASFNTAQASDPIPGFVVFIVTDSGLVQVTTLGELAEEVNLKKKLFVDEKNRRVMLQMLKNSVERKDSPGKQ